MRGWLTSRGTILLAPARPADSKGKLYNSLPVDKINKREDVLTWIWCLSHSRDVVILEKVETCKFSTITIWSASKNKLNNPNHDSIASPTPNGWAKADSFEADSIVLLFEKNILISNGQNLVK